MIDKVSVQNISYVTRTTSQDNTESNVELIKEGQNVSQVQEEKTRTETSKAEKEDQIEEVIKGINDFLQPTHTSIKFVLHKKLDDYYVNIVDDETQEVIKEIPSKKLLDTYAAMMDFVGLMVDEKA